MTVVSQVKRAPSHSKDHQTGRLVLSAVQANRICTICRPTVLYHPAWSSSCLLLYSRKDIPRAMASMSREIILASSPDQPIAAYDPLMGTMLAHFSSSRCPRGGLALAGNALIAASHISAAASGFIHLYNWWSSTALHCIPTSEPVAPLITTPDGSYLFAGGLSGRIHAFSLPSGDLYHSFQAHRQSVSCLAVSDDGSLLLSGGDDGTIAVFPIIRLLDASAEDDTTQLALYQFNAHHSSVTGIAAGQGGCSVIVVSSSLDCMCKLWSLADGRHLRNVRFPCALWCCVIDSTNSKAYAGGSDGCVYVIPTRARRRMGADEVEMVAWAAEQSGAVMALAMANGDRNLISASEDGVIRIWEVESQSIVRVLGLERGSVSDLLVVKGVAGGGGASFRDEATRSNGESAGFCMRELCKQVGEVQEMEQWLSVVMKDRSRAIDRLEAAIGTYEKLLGLLLIEAKGGDGKESQGPGVTKVAR